MSTPSIKTINLPTWAVWLCAFLCVWLGLGSYGVLNNNEGLYAQIPHEMLQAGDFRHWIIPTLNGLPYLEKPPLLYWLTALSFTIFGQSEWAMRLVPTFAGLATVSMLMRFGERIYRPQLGRVAALIFISSFGVMVMCRTLLFDMLMTACLTSALLLAYLFKLEGNIKDLRRAHIALGLAVLSKGFVAILLFGIITLTWIALIYGRSALRQFIKWIDPVSIGLFFVITAPWLITASLMEPEFAWFFFINEHVLRFLGLRLPHDFYSGAWWYYLPRMLIFLFPWSFLIPIALFAKWSKRSRIEIQEFTVLRKTLIFGWLVPLIFFSASNAKANYYLIVGMPFAALNLALLLEQSDYLNGKRIALLGFIIALIAAAGALYLQFPNAQLIDKLSQNSLQIIGLPWYQFVLYFLWIFAAIALCAAWFSWKVPQIGLGFYVAVPLALMMALLIGAHAMNDSISDKGMARFIEQTLPNRTVYMYRNYEQNSSLPFYLRTPLKVIDSTSSDLYWGNKLRPDNDIMISLDQFKSQKGAAAVIVPNNYLNEFAHKKLHTRFKQNKQFSYATLFY